MTSNVIELSIIIPTLNEERTIVPLLQDLDRQKDIHLEIIVCDGGSTDNTQSVVQATANKMSVTVNFVECETGRGRQMNFGVTHSHANELLFLHADTRICNRRLLANAAITLSQQRRKSPDISVAGHFGLSFQRANNSLAAAYYFYESKTHLNRPDSINGDQGFWVSRKYFEELGKFDESLPFMEDARLAQRIFKTGKWITLPGVVETSARRFETEGFTQRQIINSFLCNFNSIGEDYFFAAALDVYRAQDKSKKLSLQPFLHIAHAQIIKDGALHAIKRVYKTGGYIADNIWQLAFALDCRRNRKFCLVSGEGPANILRYYDKKLAWFFTSPPMRAIVGLATITWFYSLFIWTKLRARDDT